MVTLQTTEGIEEWSISAVAAQFEKIRIRAITNQKRLEPLGLDRYGAAAEACSSGFLSARLKAVP
jgi:hypothetical protein